MARKEWELSESEWTILWAVWGHEPCAAPTVQEALAEQKGWAYTTIKTMMDRMVKKGLLEVEKIRHLHLYRSAITPGQARKSEIGRTLRRAFNNSLTPMMQFLMENNELAEKEYAEMEAVLKRRKAAAKRKKAGGNKK